MPGGSAPECAPLPRPSYLAICAHNAVARPERLPAGIAVFHALHFALDICNMPSPLFTGLPAMMQNLPFVKHGGSSTRRSSARPASLDVQFLRDALASHLDFAFVPASGCRIVGKLHPQPRLLRAAECSRQPDSHVRADAGLAVHDLVESLPGDAENLCP